MVSIIIIISRSIIITRITIAVIIIIVVIIVVTIVVTVTVGRYSVRQSVGLSLTPPPPLPSTRESCNSLLHATCTQHTSVLPKRVSPGVSQLHTCKSKQRNNPCKFASRDAMPKSRRIACCLDVFAWRCGNNVDRAASIHEQAATGRCSLHASTS